LQRDAVSPLALEFLRRGKRRDAAVAAAIEYEAAHAELTTVGHALAWLANALATGASPPVTPEERANALLAAALQGLQSRFNKML
jgi:hypothetical protein